MTLEGAEQSFSVAMGGLAFAFREGALVTAVREGHWLLLDEINLAPPEVCDTLMRSAHAVAWMHKISPRTTWSAFSSSSSSSTCR